MPFYNFIFYDLKYITQWFLIFLRPWIKFPLPPSKKKIFCDPHGFTFQKVGIISWNLYKPKNFSRRCDPQFEKRWYNS